MLMLTHTYLLQRILGREAPTCNISPDIYAYNIIPDLLTIHPRIGSEQTHRVRRVFRIHPDYPKAGYIMFHLLVDDLSHYGSICLETNDKFNPYSHGFSYIRGRGLVQKLLDFHKSINAEISYNDAVYRSHLIIEMVYDLVISGYYDITTTIASLAEAVNFTTNNKIEEFISTVNWVYNFAENEIREVMNAASHYITTERLRKIMNLEGRVRLYGNKFGLDLSDPITASKIMDLFEKAKILADDNGAFLLEAEKSIKKYGWKLPL